MRSVADFMDHVVELAGVAEHSDFCYLSDDHCWFWRKLTRLGWTKKTLTVDETDNIDETAPLTDAEWDELDREVRALIA